jgi:pyruvate kinase
VLIRQTAESKNVNIPIIQDLSGPRVQDGAGHHFGGEEEEEVITDKDIMDLSFGIQEGIEYVALSYTGDANDILKLRKLIEERGGNQKIIAKIERRKAYENLEKIIEVTDAVMVARGDLGNEFPVEEIPFIQHHIIKEMNKASKMVIVATEMMKSMTDSPVPTRAEVSDVSYAVLDGADAVMLSEESARGKYPKEAVSIMSKIILVAEENKNNNIKIG